MWIDNEIYLNDLDSILNDKNIDWKMLKNKSILVTGATGLIGSNIVNSLLYANKKIELNCKVYALVRSIEKANSMFKVQIDENLNFIVSDICSEIDCKNKIDFIIHAASQTASKKFVDEAVQTIETAIKGTKNVLDLAKKNSIEGMVYLSTMEVYGRPQNDEKIDEFHSTDLNTMEVRNCYPISKRMCENLCACYNVNVKVARLTQTFGPGVDYNDNRVFAQFARCAIENKDIVLHTKGETKRSYLYTADAVRAIFTILLKGKNNEVYNVANENTYCSIHEMAEIVANECADKKINVKFEIEENINKFGYAPTLCMNLDTKKLKNIGWEANANLIKMFNNLIKTIEEE